MHIAYYCNGWPESAFPGGIMRYVAFQAREMLARGHKVSILTSNLGKNADKTNVHVVTRSLGQELIARLYSRIDPDYQVFAFGKSLAKAFQELHDRSPIDVIEIEESFGWFGNVQAALRVPVVLKLHGPIFLAETARSKARPFIRRRIEQEGKATRKALTVTAPSRCTLEQTLKFYNASPALTQCIRNPISIDDATPLWALENCEPQTLLFIGRFDPIKGGDFVLQAFRQLLQRRPNLQLIFVGSDMGVPSGNGQMHFAEYLAHTFPEPLRKQIAYRGVLPQTEISHLRAGSLLTMVTSVWENSPYAALEAMIQGCPVVAINSGGVGEIIEHGVTGLLARPADLEDFCDNVMKIVDEPELGRRMGLAAREFVLHEHSPPAIAAQSEAFYAQAIENSKK